MGDPIGDDMTVVLLRPIGLALLGFAVASCAPSSSSTIRLNEVLPSNGRACPDEAGEHNDWVELYNTGDLAVDLGGYSLTDDTAVPRQSVIPGGVTIEARSALLLWADATPAQGKTHLTFKFKSSAEQVVLYDADVLEVDSVRWSNATTDVSYGRLPDGTGPVLRCALPTCGQDNSASCGASP